MASPDTAASAPAAAPAPTPASGRRKLRWLRFLLYAFGALLLLALIVAAAAVLWLRSAATSALPQIDGEIHLGGAMNAPVGALSAPVGALSAPVIVRRDTHGVPHIEAASQTDLFLAQGYITAQDRLWQMDLYRRNAGGELAEVLGASLVEHDKAQRILGFRRQAQRIYANLPAGDRARLDAYARGVNLFIGQNGDKLPAEFRLLHYAPRPWTGEDSILVATMMIDELDSHWDTKLVRERIAARLGKLPNTTQSEKDKLEAALYPVGSWRDHPPTGEVIDLTKPQPIPPAPKDEDDENTTAAVNVRDLRQTLGLPDCDGCAAGSNNWVVSGVHTASGKPLLSNDMHLGITVPNIWYMADLKAPGYHAAGVTLPGMPMVIAGHNEHVAWGFTALYADVQDLYVEKLDGKGHYQDLDTEWKPLHVDREVIHVRGGADVTLDVQSTAHGPIITPILHGESRPIALKWSFYDPALHSLPIYAMNTAANWSEFSAALPQWCWPTLNLVYADDAGHIAYHAIGKIPVRGPSGHNLIFGKPLPHDKSDMRFEWGNDLKTEPIYIPFDQLPNSVDPPSGFLATANSQVTTDKSPYPLTLEWGDPYRTERIYKLLQGRDKLTPANMLAAQTDIYSEVDQEMAHRFAYALDHSAPKDKHLHQAADLLRSWDGKLTTDSAAASIVAKAREALWPLILEPKLGPLAADYSWSEKTFAEEEIIMHGETDWLPPGYKTWDDVLTEAVRRGLANGHAPADLSHWSYGSWHVIDIEHPLHQILPWLTASAGTGAQPLSGDGTTVKQVGRAFGPSQRFTMDWSSVDGSTENISLGESGNPYSDYFRDQWKDYYRGTTFALPFTDAAVAANTRHTLRLVP
jgi:penicillin G amidase